MRKRYTWRNKPVRVVYSATNGAPSFQNISHPRDYFLHLTTACRHAAQYAALGWRVRVEKRDMLGGWRLYREWN